MSLINNIACSISCDFNSNNSLVKLAETIAIPCKWLLGTKTITARRIFKYHQTNPTDNYIKIALGMTLFVPAAIFSTVCINLAAHSNNDFRLRFSQAQERIAYNQICSLLREKRKTDSDNINKTKPYWEEPSKEQQNKWLFELLISCSKDEVKKEVIKQKLRQELISRPEIIFEILNNAHDTYYYQDNDL
jgi:hypothetical protein